MSKMDQQGACATVGPSSAIQMVKNDDDEGKVVEAEHGENSGNEAEHDD